MSGSGVGCPECYPHPRHVPGECECCDCQSNSRTNRIADWLAAKAQADLDEHVSPEIQALLRRGNVTPAEVAELRCNSWEWELLVQVMTDDAFVARVEHALENCSRHKQPFVSYDEAVQGLYAPELLRRFKAISGLVAALSRGACGECGHEHPLTHIHGDEP